MSPAPFNVWTARVIPVCLTAIIGYVSWIIVVRAVGDYYLTTGESTRPPRRLASGIAILVIYLVLFLLLISSFFRMLFTVATNPGYIRPSAESPRPKHWGKRSGNIDETKGWSNWHTSIHRIVPLGASWPAPQLLDFANKEMYMCDERGFPKWCSTCRIWRPDRARHCREVDRCILKMDHFCPWVGGIVSDVTFKFFIQFNTYTVLYALFDLIIAGVCINESRGRGETPNGHIITMLILGVFFMMLTLGIGLSAWLLALTGQTTPENVSAETGQSWRLAIRVDQGTLLPAGTQTIALPECMPRASMEELEAFLQKNDGQDDCSASADSDKLHSTTFAIVKSDPRMNPYDLGCKRNWQQVMGRKLSDWILPIKPSPWSCGLVYAREGTNATKSPPTSFFLLGPDLKVIKSRLGLCQISQDEQHSYEARQKARNRFPYLLGGAGAPKKQWAAFMKRLKSRE